MSLHYHLDFTWDKFDKDKGSGEGNETGEGNERRQSKGG